MNKKIFILAWIIAINFACDPCSNCDHHISEPFLKLKIINGKALKKTLDSLEVVDTLLHYVQRWETLDNLIENSDLNKDSLQNVRQAVLEKIDQRTDLRNQKSQLYSFLKDTLSRLLTVKKNYFLSGKTKLDSLVFVNSGRALVVADSILEVVLPLSFTEENNHYNLHFNQSVFDLQVSQQLTDSINAFDKKIVRYAAIKNMASSKFDSLRITCISSQCQSHTSLAYAYY